jgi:hypothetical protein
MCSPRLEVDGGERNPAGGGRPRAGSVSPTGAALRHSPCRGKRLRRHDWTSWSRRWRRLALGGGDRDESTSTAHRPAARLHGRRRRSCGSGGAGPVELRHAAERTRYIGVRDARSPGRARPGGGGAGRGCLGQSVDS